GGGGRNTPATGFLAGLVREFALCVTHEPFPFAVADAKCDRRTPQLILPGRSRAPAASRWIAVAVALGHGRRWRRLETGLGVESPARAEEERALRFEAAAAYAVVAGPAIPGGVNDVPVGAVHLFVVAGV